MNIYTTKQHNFSVKLIYAGWRYYQIKGLDYSPKGKIFELSIQESKFWLLNFPKLYSQIALRECLMAGTLCNNSYLEEKEGQWTVVGDLNEGALIAAGSKAKLYQSQLKQLKPKLDTFRFDSTPQSLATLHSDLEGKTIYLKGSVEKVLPRAQQMLDANGNIISFDSKLVKWEAQSMTRKGLTVFAFAKKLVSSDKTKLDDQELENGFTFLGFQGID